MSATTKTQVWFDRNGNLMTNNPQAFAKQFYIPDTVPVDGIQRVSFNARKIRTRSRRKPR